MANRYCTPLRKKNGMVKGWLIPNGSDADWSDEDGVKSGSATGFSEAETDELSKEKRKAVIMNKSLNGRKYDPVNSILDKIDAELSSLNKSQSSSATGSTVLRRPGSRSKGSNGSRSGGSHKSLSDKDGADTGLGTSSIHDNLSEGGDQSKINGTAEIYSDVGATIMDRYSDDRGYSGTAAVPSGDNMYAKCLDDGKKTGDPSDLDSVTAQQVDAKFKAILRKKKGGYLGNLKASDTETVRTEDYENKFKDIMVFQSDSDTLKDPSDEGTLTDAESPAKNDLSWDYYDTDQSKADQNGVERDGVSDKVAGGPTVRGYPSSGRLLQGVDRTTDRPMTSGYSLSGHQGGDRTYISDRPISERQPQGGDRTYISDRPISERRPQSGDRTYTSDRPISERRPQSADRVYISDRPISEHQPQGRDRPDVSYKVPVSGHPPLRGDRRDISDKTPATGLGLSAGRPPQGMDAQTRGKGRLSYPTNGMQSLPWGQTSQPRKKFGYVSDADSVRTEDFEGKFQELLIRPSGESEADLTDNDPLHAKVKDILKVTAPYRHNKEKKFQNTQAKIEESPVQRFSPRRNYKDRQHRNSSQRQAIQNWMLPGSSGRDTSVGGRATRESVRQQFRKGDSTFTSSLESSLNYSKTSLQDNHDTLLLDPSNLSPYNSTRYQPLMQQPLNLPVHNTQSQRLSEPSDQQDSSPSSTSSLESSQCADNKHSRVVVAHRQLSRTDSCSNWSSVSTGYPASLLESDEQQSSLSSLMASDSLCGLELQSDLPSPLFKKLFDSVDCLLSDSEGKAFQRQRCVDGSENYSFDPQSFLRTMKGNKLESNGSSNGIMSNGGKREVFQPEDQEEFPFSLYTFNKKPETSNSTSASSRDSVMSESQSLASAHSRRNFSRSVSYSSIASGSYTDYLEHEACQSLYGPPMYQSLSAYAPQQDMPPPPLGPTYTGEGIMAMPCGHTPADMLNNLGFGGVGSFLPDRFAKDWCEKIRRAQQEKMEQQMRQTYQQLQEARARTLSRQGSHLSQVVRQESAPQTESTIQKLQQLLQPEDGDSVHVRRPGTATPSRRDVEMRKAGRRKLFSSNRQTSLPIYLETLDENGQQRSRRRGKRLTHVIRPALSTIDHSDTCSNNSNSSASDHQSDTIQHQIEDFKDNVPSPQDQNSHGYNDLEWNSQCQTDPNQNSQGHEDPDQSVQGQDKTDPLNNQSQRSPDDVTESQGSLDKACVPSICINPHREHEPLHSRDSLELAQIMVDQGTAHKLLGNKLSRPKSSHLLRVNIVDDRLLTASPMSGASSSPGIFSPITVIEVNLDNQNDSLDAEEGNNHSSDCFHHILNKCVGLSSPLGYHDDHNHAAGVRRNSFVDNLAFNDCRERLVKMEKKRSFSFDLQYKSDLYAKMEDISDEKLRQGEGDCDNSGSGQYVIQENGIKRRECSDMCVQADDGSLSPLLRECDMEAVIKCLQVLDMADHTYYLARDRGTQWETPTTDGGSPKGNPDLMNERGSPRGNQDLMNKRGSPKGKPDIMNERGSPRGNQDIMNERVAPRGKPDIMNERGSPRGKPDPLNERGSPRRKPDIMNEIGSPWRNPDLMSDKASPRGTLNMNERGFPMGSPVLVLDRSSAKENTDIMNQRGSQWGNQDLGSDSASPRGNQYNMNERGSQMGNYLLMSGRSTPRGNLDLKERGSPGLMSDRGSPREYPDMNERGSPRGVSDLLSDRGSPREHPDMNDRGSTRGVLGLLSENGSPRENSDFGVYTDISEIRNYDRMRLHHWTDLQTQVIDADIHPVTVDTGKEPSEVTHDNDVESTGFPVTWSSKRASVDSQTLRKYFSDHWRDSVCQTSVDDCQTSMDDVFVNQATQTEADSSDSSCICGHRDQVNRSKVINSNGYHDNNSSNSSDHSKISFSKLNGRYDSETKLQNGNRKTDVSEINDNETQLSPLEVTLQRLEQKSKQWESKYSLKISEQKD